jgi:hypothetical protein
MGSFELYIDDERYSVPQLAFVVADNRAAAVEMATAMMRENRHYRGIELRSGDALQFAAGSMAGAPRAPRDPCTNPPGPERAIRS